MNKICSTHFVNIIKREISNNVNPSSTKIVGLAIAIIGSLALLLYCLYSGIKNYLKLPVKQLDANHPSIALNDKLPSAGKQTHPNFDFDQIFNSLADQTSEAYSQPCDNQYCLFPNIPCPAPTQVKIAGSPQSFLHANHIKHDKGDFIALQYPLEAQFPLLWKVSQNGSLIVDLTNDADQKNDPRLMPYYPIDNTAKEYSGLKVLLEHAEDVQGIDASLNTYNVEGPEGFKKVTRLHFRGWNDHQGTSVENLNHLVSVMERFHKASFPILVHCRGGVGRTGTLITTYLLKQMIAQNKVDSDNLMDHIRTLILFGRSQRGSYFVLQPRQLKTIWEFGVNAIKDKATVKT